MSLIPHEINTMKHHIIDAFGNVLVLGLGLGYYVFHIARKKDVDKITIIEKDKRVIKIFKENLLPYFENKDKITIIEDDAIKYLSTPKDYDYCFLQFFRYDCLQRQSLYDAVEFVFVSKGDRYFSFSVLVACESDVLAYSLCHAQSCVLGECRQCSVLFYGFFP